MPNSPQKIGIIESVLLFLIPGILFWIHLNWTVPLITNVFQLSVYAAWLIIGSFLLFFPIFILAIVLMKMDGYSLDWTTIFKRLRIKKVTKSDWLWIVLGLLVTFSIVGVIIFMLVVLPLGINISELKEISPIEAQQLMGNERFFLVLLPFLFFFNYVGEEILWRGYILPRQEVSYGKYAWVINGVLHGVFHLPFGMLTHIIAIPIYLLIPFITYKTKNTTTAIIIHFLLGAPMQILLALGILL